MKKILLISGMALSLSSAVAQSKFVYEDWSTNRLHYWTNNQDALGATLYAGDAADPLNPSSNTVGKFDRQANDMNGNPMYWTMMTAKTKCVAKPSDWCTMFPKLYPFMSMDVYAADSLKVKIVLKDKSLPSELDLGDRDAYYTVEDKGKWKKLIFDFSYVAPGDWTDDVEMQMYFSHGVAKNITVYYDNIIGGKTMADVVGVAKTENNVAEVLQNAPNPASDITNISYSLKSSNDVSVKVFNALGSEVATLVNQKQAAGIYNHPFDVSALPSGLYYYSLNVGGSIYTKKMQVLNK